MKVAPESTGFHRTHRNILNHQQKFRITRTSMASIVPRRNLPSPSSFLFAHPLRLRQFSASARRPAEQQQNPTPASSPSSSTSPRTQTTAATPPPKNPSPKPPRSNPSQSPLRVWPFLVIFAGGAWAFNELVKARTGRVPAKESPGPRPF